MVSSSKLAVGVLAAVGGVDAFWRMPCRSRTGLARLDPLMDNGDISDHVHAIHGGGSMYFQPTRRSAFVLTMQKTLV